MAFCVNCGVELEPGETVCSNCGVSVAGTESVQSYSEPEPQPTPVEYVQPEQNSYVYQDYYADPSWPERSKVVAGLLAIFLGGIGIHKFYLRKVVWGIVYILFCWTYIPAVVALIEGIILLASNDQKFEQKYHVRIKRK